MFIIYYEYITYFYAQREKCSHVGTQKIYYTEIYHFRKHFFRLIEKMFIVIRGPVENHRKV